jgi:hypothetical protein
MGTVFTPETCKQLVKQHVGPDAADGKVSREMASALVFQRYAALHLAPVGPIIVEVLNEAGVR